MLTILKWLSSDAFPADASSGHEDTGRADKRPELGLAAPLQKKFKALGIYKGFARNQLARGPPVLPYCNIPQEQYRSPYSWPMLRIDGYTLASSLTNVTKNFIPTLITRGGDRQKLNETLARALIKLVGR